MSDVDDQQTMHTLHAMLEELVEQSREGRQPDFAAVVGDRTDLEPELRELWATAMMAEDLVSVSAALDDLTAEQQHSSPEPKPRSPLPRDMGDYTLIEELGRGGMGVVYRAHQKSLNRVVAVKTMLRGEFAAPDELSRFMQEAEAAARLSHPLIVPVYEVGEWAGQPYFSMMYVEGTTLSRRIADGPLSPREAARLLARVCRAIAVAHDEGVLHRDLKPSNILIDGTGRPFITDFGLAKQFTADPAAIRSGQPLDPVTFSGAVLGTPSYMAPEQAAGSRGSLSRATDVYSLGAILYAMLTGRPPFQAASPVDTVLMVLEQDPLPPRLLNPQVDPELTMIALKAMQKPADLRYASAGAMADDLDAYLAHEPIAARSSHFSQILSRAFRPTHHVEVLQNWGVLWMWHALVLLGLCLMTNSFHLRGVTSRTPYVWLWTLGLGLWAAFFWKARRRAGPVTFVERQIAHVWAGSMTGSMMLFALERLLGLPVLTLSPVLGLLAGSVFLVKAAILSGEFYLPAVLLYATALVMALSPAYGLTIFGIVSAGCFFVPGLKFYRQRRVARDR